ncbi:exported hypothetical protein [Stutzerimonas xanthomarina]|nr:exported hypothetical protein [Stutzerimonas xanthomarina]
MTISMGASSTLPPKSSAAIFAASNDHLPPKSAYTPDWSLRMPIFTLPSEISAEAGTAATAVRVATAIAESFMRISLHGLLGIRVAPCEAVRMGGLGESWADGQARNAVDRRRAECSGQALMHAWRTHSCAGHHVVVESRRDGSWKAGPETSRSEAHGRLLLIVVLALNVAGVCKDAT